jgi:hypothetical protein
MPTKTREEILQMAIEMLEKDEGLRRALEVFQLGQSEYLKALATTQSVQIFSDDKTIPNLSAVEDADEKLD